MTAVWLGNDDYTRMNESYGGNVPARTWARFMKAALQGVPKHDFVYPSTEVRKLAYCGSPHRFEYFLEGTEPFASCAAAGYSGRPAAAAVDAPPVGAEPVTAAAPDQSRLKVVAASHAASVSRAAKPATASGGGRADPVVPAKEIVPVGQADAPLVDTAPAAPSAAPADTAPP